MFLHTIESPPTLDGPVEGVGSGVVIDRAGSIITNAHVVAAAEIVHVRMPDGTDRPAKVLRTDAVLDLALLRVDDARGLIPAPLGTSAAVRVGEWVVAIGNPMGLHHTVTVGIVSGKARSAGKGEPEFLQTDAAINRGSSGGPLLNLRGEVVGITTAMLSRTGENSGLNFAIPVDVIRAVLAKWRVADDTAPAGRSQP